VIASLNFIAGFHERFTSIYFTSKIQHKIIHEILWSPWRVFPLLFQSLLLEQHLKDHSSISFSFFFFLIIISFICIFVTLQNALRKSVSLAFFRKRENIFLQSLEPCWGRKKGQMISNFHTI
jgi:hypothetical protein